MYNAKNYTEQGGDVTHIGGKLVIDEGGSIEGGVVANQAASTATDVEGIVADFNTLLGALKEAGIMAADAD